jgi:uncharacterized RDD family membrane protein YckC
LEGARADRRELSGIRRRAIALGIDVLVLAVIGYFIGPWVLLLAAANFIVCHRLLGQTLGKWLLGIRVENPQGGHLSWKAAAIRFVVSAWGPLAWSVLGSVIYFLHHEQRVVFRLSGLSWSVLAIPLLYAGLALAILVAYLAGFMLVAFHPRRLALHDILAGTQVCFKSPPPAAVQVIDAVKATSLGRRNR